MSPRKSANASSIGIFTAFLLICGPNAVFSQATSKSSAKSTPLITSFPTILTTGLDNYDQYGSSPVPYNDNYNGNYNGNYQNNYGDSYNGGNNYKGGDYGNNYGNNYGQRPSTVTVPIYVTKTVHQTITNCGGSYGKPNYYGPPPITLITDPIVFNGNNAPQTLKKRNASPPQNNNYYGPPNPKQEIQFGPGYTQKKSNYAPPPCPSKIGDSCTQGSTICTGNGSTTFGACFMGKYIVASCESNSVCSPNNQFSPRCDSILFPL
ncbi:hypothetical protein AYI68_g3534 [Smittium mucronatum]|uniref:Uncharacterized protein n=1 Tax=Smittium mucronatum TaxID=133383 RepID=A0A1R0GZN1_9FUNG|nr:hypothetical protein AYI68_g3534 [Smittium mucronatum]